MFRPRNIYSDTVTISKAPWAPGGNHRKCWYVGFCVIEAGGWSGGKADIGRYSGRWEGVWGTVICRLFPICYTLPLVLEIYSRFANPEGRQKEKNPRRDGQRCMRVRVRVLGKGGRKQFMYTFIPWGKASGLINSSNSCNNGRAVFSYPLKIFAEQLISKVLFCIFLHLNSVKSYT